MMGAMKAKLEPRKIGTLTTGAELEQQGAYTGAKAGPWRVQTGEQGHQHHGTEGDKQNLQPATLCLTKENMGILNF